MIRTLLFDADGVLLLHSDKFFSDRLAEELGIPVKEVLVFFQEVYADCLVGKQDLKTAIAPYAKKWGWPGSVDELLKFWFDYERQANEPLIEYVYQLRQRGVSSYVATNSEKYRAEYLFTELGFRRSFDGLFAAGNLGVSKPDPTYFEKVLAAMPGIEKTELLFWDDTPGHVAAAKQFGFNAELYTTFEDFTTKMEHYGYSS